MDLDDAPSAVVSVDPLTVNEASGSVDMTARLSMPLPERTSFSVDVFALSDAEATGTSPNVVFEAGQTEQRFGMNIIDDLLSESDEELPLRASPFDMTTLAFVDTAVDLGPLTIIDNDGRRTDSTPPTVQQHANMTVLTTEPVGSSVPVTYTVVASDDVDPSPVVSCTPGSGSPFEVGQTTTVSCQARDNAFNYSASMSFEVAVSVAPVAPSRSVIPVRSTTLLRMGGLAPRSRVVATLFSEPIALGETVADADGNVELEVTIPPEAVVGDHHIELAGVSTDGAIVKAVVAVTVTPSGMADSYGGTQDVLLSVDAPGVLTNDPPEANGPVVVTSHDATSQFGGEVAVGADGSFTYQPAKGFAGVDTFEYTIGDDTGTLDTIAVTILVSATSNRGVSVEFERLDLEEAWSPAPSRSRTTVLLRARSMLWRSSSSTATARGGPRSPSSKTPASSILHRRSWSPRPPRSDSRIACSPRRFRRARASGSLPTSTSSGASVVVDMPTGGSRPGHPRSFELSHAASPPLRYRREPARSPPNACPNAPVIPATPPPPRGFGRPGRRGRRGRDRAQRAPPSATKAERFCAALAKSGSANTRPS